jgi:RNA polymerase sigma factor (sigma-70 family)
MANSVPDEDLMIEVRNGLGDRLGVLFDRYQLPLFNFYSKMTGDRVVSEDLVQEVFLRILKYRQSYRPGTPFRAWMYQIARNTRLNHVERQRRETTWNLDPAPSVSPPDSAERKQEAELLHLALMQMPEEKREVLVLSRFQELKYEEIAQLLGCEIGAVKVRVHRALRELRETFLRLRRSPRQGNSGGGEYVPPKGVGNEL